MPPNSKLIHHSDKLQDELSKRIDNSKLRHNINDEKQPIQTKDQKSFQKKKAIDANQKSERTQTRRTTKSSNQNTNPKGKKTAKTPSHTTQPNTKPRKTPLPENKSANGVFSISGAARKFNNVVSTSTDSNSDEDTSESVFKDGKKAAKATASGTVATVAHYSRKLKQSKQAEKLEEETVKQSPFYEHPKANPASKTTESVTSTNPISRWMQKQKMKKAYVEQQIRGGATGTATQTAAARATGNAARATTQAASTAPTAIPKATDKVCDIWKHFVNHASDFAKPLLALLMVFVLLTNTISSCSILGNGVLTVLAATSWPADDDDITKAEEYYTELEAKLQKKINDMQNSGNYDEYNYSVDEIEHDPVVLISYLCGKYGAFDFNFIIKHEIRELFKKQYSLKTETHVGEKTITTTVKQGAPIGKVVTSGYCNCALCCGKWAGGNTATGTKPKANHTIAVDAHTPTVPLGTQVIMNGVLYKAEDTGAFAKYGVDFDVYYDKHSDAQAHGHKTWMAYYAGGSGKEVTVKTTKNVSEYNVTLTSKDLANICKSRLNEEEKEMYEIYVESKGDRQFYGTPVDANWHENICGVYGYRVDANNKVKKYDSMRLAIPEGTKLLAVMDGTVIEKTSNSVTLEDSTHYQMTFTGLKSIRVRENDTVEVGQPIASINSNEILEIEFVVNGEHYNPYFYMTTGTKHLHVDGMNGPTSGKAAKLIREAKKYLGTPYVWGGYSPSGFDCSGFVSYAINHCGADWNFGHLTANGLKSKCKIIKKSEMKPGDLIFFQGTYNTSGASHVGIYLGNGQMIHCGKPCKISSINTTYWQSHWYCVGRLP